MRKSKVRAGMIIFIVLTAALNVACFKNESPTSNELATGLYYAGETKSADYEEYETETGDYGIQESAAQKIIRTASISLETDDFDALTAEAEEFTRSIGGYTESSNQYFYNNQYRYIHYTLRIPAENFYLAKDAIERMGVFISSAVSESDVTVSYYDIAARLAAKEIEEQRILELIDKAVETKDLIMLEERLSMVRADIGVYKSRQAGTDKDAAYAVIRLSVSETGGASEGNSLWAQVRKAFGNSAGAVVSFLQSALVIIVSLIIPLILFIIILLAARFTYKKIMRKYSKKRRRKINSAIDTGAMEAVKSLVEDVSKKKKPGYGKNPGKDNN